MNYSSCGLLVVSPLPGASTASAVTPTAGPVTVLSDANLWEGLSHCPAHIRELVDDELATYV